MPLDNIIVLIDQYHPVLTTNYTISTSSYHKCSNTDWYYDFNNANYDLMNYIIDSYNWSNVYELSDVNATLNIFNGVVLNAIERTVPITLVRSFMFPRCFSKDLHVLINEKKCLHKLF